MAKVDVEQLRKAISGGESCVVLDVREYAEYARGRVPGAMLMPLGEVERRSPELNHKDTIYVMCRSGRRSAEAQAKLHALGFKNVRDVEGGFTAWQGSGLEVERADKAPWALERQVRLVAGVLGLAGVLLSVFVAQPFIWLSGFIGAGLTFAALTDTCGMAMLLSKMPWNRAPETNVTVFQGVSTK
jgi:rhodanese-related sulfurtransferase